MSSDIFVAFKEIGINSIEFLIGIYSLFRCKALFFIRKNIAKPNDQKKSYLK